MTVSIPSRERRQLGVCGNGHDVCRIQPSMLLDIARARTAPADEVSAQERLTTALHEAAHAVVAVANGHKVRFATIKPTPASDYAPGTLGRVCTWPMSPPTSEDCWVQSQWLESYLMLYLSGYLVEDVLFPKHPLEEGRRFEPSDHRRVVEALRTVLPHDVERARSTVASIRVRALRVLELPDHVAILLRVAHLLLCEETISGDALYERLLDGRCSAVHPTIPTIRCNHPPHPYGEHFRVSAEGTVEAMWNGFRIPNRRERVSALPGNVRRLRGLNAGGPPPRLTERWIGVLDACDELDLPADDWASSPMSHLRRSLWAPAGSESSTLTPSTGDGSSTRLTNGLAFPNRSEQAKDSGNEMSIRQALDRGRGR